MLGGKGMITMPEPMLDKLLHLSDSQISIIASVLESLPDKETTKDVRFRIGAAKHISCPSNFDDIDYGTSELFGL